MPQNRDNQVSSSSPSGEWVDYWALPVAGETELELPEWFVILMILNGEVELTFNQHGKRTISKESLIVIDRKQLTRLRWGDGTEILEFIPPEKIFRFFCSCSSSFQTPCSTIVPVHPNLKKWIDDLMNERLQPKEMLTDIRRRDYCVRLGNILRSYPPLLVGELLVPFQACSLSGTKKCKGELCE